MPIYEFICESCGNEFEKILSFSATTTPSCPSCDANDVSRRLSRPAIHFKGSGWYITDSKASNGNGKNGADQSKSGDNEGKAGDGESKTEPATAEKSTSETKSEAKSASVSSESSS